MPTNMATTERALAWQNSRLLKGDTAKAVAALKKESGDYVLVMGSTRLVHSLIENDLVDEFRVMIEPAGARRR